MKNTLMTLALLLAATAVPAARGAASDQPARTARVATGAQVKLVESGRTPAQWMAERPRVRDLRPRVRGTFD